MPTPSAPPPLPPSFQPLSYQAPIERSRPFWPFLLAGLVAVLAGVIGMASNGFAAYTWYGLAVRCTPPAAATPPALPWRAAAKPPAANLQALTDHGPRGFPKDRRAELIKLFELPGPAADDRAEMLDRLLAQYGQFVFPADKPETVTRWRRKEPPRMPGRPAPPGPPNTDGNAFQAIAFNTPGGHLSLTNSTARIGDREVKLEDLSPMSYSSIEIEQALAGLRAAFPRITQAQLDTAHHCITSSNYRGPFSHGPLHRPVMFVDGTVSFNSGYGYFIRPDGQWLRADDAGGISLVNGVPSRPPPPPFVPPIGGSVPLMYATAGHSAAGFFAALLLTISGAITMAAKRLGPTLLMLWTPLKVVLMLLELGLALCFFHSVLTSSPGMTRFNFTTATLGLLVSLAIQFTVIAVIAIAMSRPAVQDYLGTLWLFNPRVLFQTARRTVASPARWLLLLVGLVLFTPAALHVLAGMQTIQFARFAHLIACAILLLASVATIGGFVLSFRKTPAAVALAALLLLPALASAQDAPKLSKAEVDKLKTLVRDPAATVHVKQDTIARLRVAREFEALADLLMAHPNTTDNVAQSLRFQLTNNNGQAQQLLTQAVETGHWDRTDTRKAIGHLLTLSNSNMEDCDRRIIDWLGKTEKPAEQTAAALAVIKDGRWGPATRRRAETILRRGLAPVLKADPNAEPLIAAPPAEPERDYRMLAWLATTIALPTALLMLFAGLYLVHPT